MGKGVLLRPEAPSTEGGGRTSSAVVAPDVSGGSPVSTILKNDNCMPRGTTNADVCVG